MEIDDKPVTSFDRGINFEEIKKKLIDEYEKIIIRINELDETDRYYISKRRKEIHHLIYCVISLIQLINGSRIVEACKAFDFFIDRNNFEEKVTVKLAKSKTIKYKKNTKEQYITKTRYRQMKFPSKWIDLQFIEDMKFYLKRIDKTRLMKRVLDYLLNNFKCNTHSLRYSFINHLIYDKKKEMSLVAKFVGHSSVNQIVRYTQNLQANKLFDEDL